MHLKTAGILGGLGPETTAHFYLGVISALKEKGISRRPPLLIWNVPLSYQLERDFIATGAGKDEYLSILIQGIKRLEQAQVDFIVIPCNSVHIFIERLREETRIPILSIIEETATFLERTPMKSFGFLATTPTLESGLYQARCAERGIAFATPSPEEQNVLTGIIQRLATKEHTPEDEIALDGILDSFARQEIPAVVLACTDLQLLRTAKDAFPIYDTTEILIDATAREIIEPS